MNLYMKYAMYAKKNEKEFKNKKFNSLNWEKDKKGNRICPNGHVFDRNMGMSMMNVENICESNKR